MCRINQIVFISPITLNDFNYDLSSLICKSMDGFATEATHCLSYFSSLTRSENCNRLRLLYTFQTIQTLSYTCTLTESNFMHTGTMSVKVIKYLNYSVSHRYIQYLYYYNI